jgi:pimeloyl-ACP methyl ester carboxylesterase
MTLNRYKDEPFVLDALPGWLATQEMNVIPDLDTIGMSGHSFGALTTQVMAGMLFPDKNQSLESFQEPRFTAGIAYSPGDISHLNVNDEKQAYQAICLPLLHMTGTEDRSPLTDDGYEIRLKAYQNSPAIDGKHLLVISEADHMVFAGSRGKLGQNPNREKHEQIIRVAALSYWDAMLKNDKAAQDWLTGGGFSAWLDGEGTFQ